MNTSLYHPIQLKNVLWSNFHSFGAYSMQLKSTTKGKLHGRRDKADLFHKIFQITTKIVLNNALCFCKDIRVVTVINHKQSFSLSRKYSNIHEEEYLPTLAFASTAFLHNKIKLHFVTFYRSHCHFHHSIMYSVNKAITNNIHSNFST